MTTGALPVPLIEAEAESLLSGTGSDDVVVEGSSATYGPVAGPRGEGGSVGDGSMSVSFCPNSGQASLRHSHPSSGGNARVAGWPQVGHAFT